MIAFTPYLLLCKQAFVISSMEQRFHLKDTECGVLSVGGCSKSVLGVHLHSSLFRQKAGICK